ncbi:flavin reductase [Bosea sp. CS1GBMeth4]|uniref:flavin reductase n=1 Tax=Bosea sp. CS1GBMeth4 TaxID=1892849 RepID=UPI0016479260|nr:flavin reductase [Bosea sp. CS1GBMeth4]
MNSMVDAGLRAALPEAQAFREAMAQVASAAHIVTTLGPHGRAGLTATAVTSVSVAPPTVLVCVEAASRTLAAIEASGIFCVNTLAEADHELASVFSGRRGLTGEERFAAGDWGELATGAPALASALASFDCRLATVHRVATHRILIGQVVALGGGGSGPALVYRHRRFGGF